MAQNAYYPCVTLSRDGRHAMEGIRVNGAVSESNDSPIENPDAVKLRRDIRHFERQIARLASPSSTWEHGALKCYQTLITQRRKMLGVAKLDDTL